jgi:hypothetical protein
LVPTGPLGAGAAELVLVDLLATGLGEGVVLEVEVLVAGADASVADDHRGVSENLRFMG